MKNEVAFGLQYMRDKLSLVMRKPEFCIYAKLISAFVFAGTVLTAC